MADEKGPVQILCEEIGHAFSPALERSDLLASFVRRLVLEVDRQREMASRLSERFDLPGPSEASATALEMIRGALIPGMSDENMISRAAAVHAFCHEANPEDAIPTDHLIDMVSACASAIRFGLERPCRSRHAAEAAGHVWRHRYGVDLHDRESADWSRAWARSRLFDALISMLPRSTPRDPGKEGSPPELAGEE